MADQIDLPLDDDDDHLADLPLIDLFRTEPAAGGYPVTYIPTDGDDPTRTVFVRYDAAEGRQIAASVSRIERLVGASLVAAVHRGGGSYTLRLSDGRSLGLSDDVGGEPWGTEVFARLKQIAICAELAFTAASRVPAAARL